MIPWRGNETVLDVGTGRGLLMIGAARRLTTGISVGIDIWSAKDPRAAAKWVTGLPAEEGKSTMSIVASRWTLNDPEAVTKWLNSMKGPIRDAAILGFASTIAAKDYALALGWALKISDPPSKERLSKAIATEWLRKNPNEAKPWIRSSKMPEALKKQLPGLD